MFALRRRLLPCATGCLLGVTGGAVGATRGLAVVPAAIEEPEDAPQVFPRPGIVRKQVHFWEKIFYRYPSTTVVVHEAGDPDRLIDVIDYKTFRSGDPDRPVLRKERDEVTKKYLQRYVKAADRFVREGKAAVHYGAIEQRLYDVYKSSPETLRRLLDGDMKIRAQTGLADDFLSAATAAQAYLPYMERIFIRYGVPRRLTRLPFVESMFNLRARSKVGASGIWQFMPETARNFIFVNGLVDERNSPFKATRAAAQFLLTNYRALGSWPLAVTAYNHGSLGMSKAVRQLGTADIGEIIRHYDSASFGFASSNFYAEFLAAGDTYDRLIRQHRIRKAGVLPDTEAVILQRPVSVAQLLSHTALSREVLEALNPCLLESAFTTGSVKPLPEFYEIRVPLAQAPAVKAAIQTIPTIPTKRYARK